MCGRKKPTARKNGRSFRFAHRSSTHSASSASRPSVWCSSLFGRGVPAQRAAELAGQEREDLRLLLQPIDAGRIQLQLPRARIVVAVGADRLGHVVVVQLADPGGEVAREAERLRHAELRGDRLPEDLRVRQDAGAVGIQPGQHRVAARPAERERADTPGRTATPRAASLSMFGVFASGSP